MTTPFQPSGRPRTVTIDERRGLDIQSLVLLAVLLAAGFILNFTAGKDLAVSGDIARIIISPASRSWSFAPPSRRPS
ncbi:MAG: hypothetical protein ACLVHL_00810 [Collinsella intestinalis]